MTWLLGGGIVTGLVALASSVVFVYKMYRNNRSDLFKLIDANRRLSEAQRDIGGYRRRNEDLTTALADRTTERDRERNARKIIGARLHDAITNLLQDADSRTIVTAIRDDLRMLSNLSEAEGAPAP